jgi:hypothetical protein
VVGYQRSFTLTSLLVRADGTSNAVLLDGRLAIACCQKFVVAIQLDERDEQMTQRL